MEPNAAAVENTGSLQRKAGFCALCRSRCGAQYLVQDGRMVGVEPWPEHPTGGALCAKGRAAPELLYHPRRLRQPLRRTRPRDDPDPGWVEVSWDEALNDIAARLTAIKRESGAHAVAFSSASPGATALSDSPNFLTGVEICNWHRDYGHAFTFGAGIGMPDYAQSDLIVLWGFNPSNVWLAQAQAIGAARQGGAGEQPVLLLYGSRDGAQHAFAERLAALAARLPCLSVVNVYSRPCAADRPGRDYQHSGHVGAHLVPPSWISRQARFYLCGPDAMLRAVSADLLVLGAHRFAIFRESFQPPEASLQAATGPFTVTFARSGRVMLWTVTDGNLLKLAASRGLTLPSGCLVGQCESCLLRVRSGQVVHNADVELAEADTCLGCLAMPASDLVLEA